MSQFTPQPPYPAPAPAVAPAGYAPAPAVAPVGYAQPMAAPQQHGQFSTVAPAVAPPGYAPAPGYAQPVAVGPPAGIFGGVENATRSMDNEYLKPGRYLVKVTCCKVGKTRKGEDFHAVEGDVVAVLDNAQGTGHRIGDSVTAMTPKSNDHFLKDARAFVAAAVGVTFEEVFEPQILEIYGPKQPLSASSVVMEVNAHHITTKAGTLFTKIKWIRAVPNAELLTCLPLPAQERFFPNGVLLQLATMEAGAGGLPVPSQPEWGSKAIPELAYAPPALAPAPLGTAPAVAPLAPAPGVAPAVPAPVAAQQAAYRPAPAPVAAPAAPLAPVAPVAPVAPGFAPVAAPAAPLAPVAPVAPVAPGFAPVAAYAPAPVAPALAVAYAPAPVAPALA